MEKVTFKPNYHRIDGILFPPFVPEYIRETLEYKAKAGDNFIVTYPKCGTTWMQNIVLYIFRKGQELQDPMNFHVYSPFIDAKGYSGIENMPRPGAFKTHLPYTHVPYSPDAKYIYVLRNPKDCCVSMYHHTVRAHHKVYGEASFDDFFQIFMAGEVEYNDYFDHLMSWYPHRNDKNVFFTTYEDMKKDCKSIVLKVASFLDRECIEAIEKDNSILNNILRLSEFDYMKTHLQEKYVLGHKMIDIRQPNRIEQEDIRESPKTVKPAFLRKGDVGDWKNHFSKEHNERMNEKFIERTKGTEIYDMYKSYIL